MLQEAMKMIKPEMTVSFGGGSTVARLAKYLCDEDETLRKTLKVTTPSLETMEVLNKLNYQIVALDDVEKIDVAFDGCDYATQNLNAQKCMGGIHVDEKKAAKKALRYVLLTKPERIGKTYNAKLPICAEVEQDEADLFLKMADQAGFEAKNRPGIKTSRGNLLFDLHNEKCNQADAEDVETWPGVVGTSSFFDLCTDVIYEEKGKTIHLRKEDLK